MMKEHNVPREEPVKCEEQVVVVATVPESSVHHLLSSSYYLIITKKLTTLQTLLATTILDGKVKMNLVGIVVLACPTDIANSSF